MNVPASIFFELLDRAQLAEKNLKAAQTEIKQYEEDVEGLGRVQVDLNDGCIDLEKKLGAIRESLSNVLDIIDGPEIRAITSSAWIHGVKVDQEVAQRNGPIVDAAYKLLGRERPKGDG